jgi:uncharacterized protein YheU (UPF0270 family)
MLVIPVDQLSDAALSGLIEDFVTRDGTDYGEVELSLESKASSIRRQLCSGDIVIVFDPATDSTSMLTREQYQYQLSAPPIN